MSVIEINKDDIFLMGNIAMQAVLGGQGERVERLAKLVRRERPRNAGGAMIEAMRLLHAGDRSGAIKVLEDDEILKATSNREQAVVLYVSLLTEDGQGKKAALIARHLLETDKNLNSDAQLALQFLVDTAKRVGVI